MLKKKGKFIVFEGLDGSGSSTQADMLAKYLREKGRQVFVTKEPTDNVIGGLIRGALSKIYVLPDEALQLLFAADRAHHLQRAIEPMLKSDAVVICDRYSWSSIAFGSISLDRQWLESLQQYFPSPDMVILLRVDPRECIKRISENRFDFELFEDLEKSHLVWKTYAWLARRNREFARVVDGEGKPEEVLPRVIKAIQLLKI